MRLILVTLLVGILGSCNAPTRPIKTVSEGVPLGRSCGSDDDCEGGLCVELAAGNACMPTCASDVACDSDQRCTSRIARVANAPTVCLSAPLALCSVCEVDADCGGPADLCLPSVEDGTMVCASDCRLDGVCPEGYACEDILDAEGEALGRQCRPTSKTCSCTPENDGLTRTCENDVVDLGACRGLQVCDGNTGFSACDAPMPSPEKCDGIDNDCDGSIDLDESQMPLSRMCLVGAGEGPECEAVQSCINGEFESCPRNGRPVEESTCDALDNDCDGEVDEGLIGDIDACASCGDVCPPGLGFSQSTHRGCDSNTEGFVCSPIQCFDPYFDVNADASDGCEVVDDRLPPPDAPFANNMWATAYETGFGAITDSDSSQVFRCDSKLPDDGRVHIGVDIAEQNVDFHRVYVVDQTWPVLETRFCAEFQPENAQDNNALFEVCISNGTLAAPSFPQDRCTLIALEDGLVLDVDADNPGSNNIYARIRNFGPAYSGSYDLSFYDEGSCPLNSDENPCD